MSSYTQTPNQPVLPAEVPFTEAELIFMDESPPGLYPENQNSNFGFIIRKVFSDLAQDISDLQLLLYNEKFVETSVQYLDQWEIEVGLPPNPSDQTIAQRRSNVLARLQHGPFTRTRRANIVELFIEATFGSAITFDLSGVPLTSGGIPLYSGEGSLDGTYAIRENGPSGTNILPNSSFESGLTGWAVTQDAGMVSNDLSQSATWSMYGTKSAHVKWTQPADTNFRSALFYSTQGTGGMPVTPGGNYTASAYLNVINPPGIAIALFIFWWKASGAPSATPYSSQNFPTNSQGRLSVSATAPSDAAFASIVVDFTTTTANDVIEAYIDGIQFEKVTKNLVVNPSFDSDVSGWTHTNNTLALGTAGATPPFGNNACNVVCTTNTIAEMHTDPLPISAGLDYTFSAYIDRLVGNRSISLQIQWYGVGSTYLGAVNGPVVPVPSGSFTRFSISGTAPPNATGALCLIAFGPGAMAVNDQFYVDGVQLEQASAPTAFGNPSSYVDAAGTPFFYEVRIKNTISVDVAGLTRELKRITPAGISFSIASVPSLG